MNIWEFVGIYVSNYIHMYEIMSVYQNIHICTSKMYYEYLYWNGKCIFSIQCFEIKGKIQEVT